MGQVLAWLGIPVLATLAAIAWVMWTSRPRARQDVSDSVAGYERFKAALAQASSPGDPASQRPADDEPRAPASPTSSALPPSAVPSAVAASAADRGRVSARPPVDEDR